MKKIQTIITLLFVFGLTACAQTKKYKENSTITVVAYNVENLFDTINSPNTNDEEFTPQSKKQWNTQRYHQKLRNLSYVLSHINTHEFPELVALEEIENQNVLNDLVSQEAIKKANYKIVHEESPDHRGIDVALLYRSDVFHYISHEKIPVHFDFDPGFATRDILHVQGKVDGEIWHIFVNHWPSRWGGQEKSEPNRLAVAKILRDEVNKVQAKNPEAKIIIMGDFNDTPFNKSIKEVLNAGDDLYPQNKNELYNLLYDKASLGLGTNAYRGKYTMIDNLIVSYSFLNAKKGYRVAPGGVNVFKNEKITFFNNKAGIWQPNRSFSGNKYYGGFSDHLPVYMILHDK